MAGAFCRLWLYVIMKQLPFDPARVERMLRAIKDKYNTHLSASFTLTDNADHHITFGPYYFDYKVVKQVYLNVDTEHQWPFELRASLLTDAEVASVSFYYAYNPRHILMECSTHTDYVNAIRQVEPNVT